MLIPMLPPYLGSYTVSHMHITGIRHFPLPRTIIYTTSQCRSIKYCKYKFGILRFCREAPGVVGIILSARLLCQDRTRRSRPPHTSIPHSHKSSPSTLASPNMPQPLPSKDQSLFRQVVRHFEMKQYKKGWLVLSLTQALLTTFPTRH